MTPAELTQRREALGISKYRLAKLIGISKSTVGRWESGQQNISRAQTLLDAALERLEAQSRQEDRKMQRMTFEQFCKENGRQISPGFDEAERAEGERRQLIELWEAGVRNGSIVPPILTEEEGEAMERAREASLDY